MKVQESVKKTTLNVALGTLILTALMLVVFLLCGALDASVLLGALLGFTAAVANFFLMGVAVQKVTESIHGAPRGTAPQTEPADAQDEEMQVDPPLTEEQQQEVKAAKKRMQRSYMGRLCMQLAVLAIAAFAPCFSLLATAIPLLFPGLVVKIMGILNIGMD